MKPVKQGDIIKGHGELLYVSSVSNQGTYRCEDKHGKLVWSSYLQAPDIVKRKEK